MQNISSVTNGIYGCKSLSAVVSTQANKVWNASRFIMMNMAQMKEQGLDAAVAFAKEEALTDADRWILSKANDLVRDVTDNLERFEMGIAAPYLSIPSSGSMPLPKDLLIFLPCESRTRPWKSTV